MATFLAGFDRAGGLKTALDLAERSGLKPPPLAAIRTKCEMGKPSSTVTV
jgi:hypothetical protein